MNFIELQDKIKAEPELIVKVLEHLDYQDIREKPEYFACKNPDGDNSNALIMYKNSLQYTNYTRGHSGSIISLVMETKGCKFPKALEYIAKWTGIKTNDIQIVRPFHGFYKDIIADKNGDIPDMQVYDESLLPSPNNFPLKWVKEGIDLCTQQNFGVRYDFDSDGIIIPEYTIDGKLCGAKWRNNDPNCSMNERWNMYLKFNQSHNLYGLNNNYVTIQKKKKLILVESEKSVMLLNSWGCGLGVSVNGHNISKVQETLVKGLMCDEVCVAFDHDICPEEVEYNCKKLVVDNVIYNNKVSYIYDFNNITGEKDSPCDCGKAVFTKLFKERKKVI